MRNLKLWPILATLLLVAACYLPVVVCNKDTVAWLASEDHLVEWTGTLACLATSIVLFACFFRDRTGNDLGFLKTRKNVFFLLLGLLLFWAFIEEISWGQRIFGFATPSTFIEKNEQHEFNIHNLEWFMHHRRGGGLIWLTNAQTLFNIFWGVYGFLVPLCMGMSATFSRLIKKTNVPVVPISLGIGYVVNVFVWQAMVHLFPDVLGIQEYAETASEILILLVAICFFVDLGRRRDLNGRAKTEASVSLSDMVGDGV